MAVCSRVAEYPIYDIPEDMNVQRQMEERNKEFVLYHEILKKGHAIRRELLQDKKKSNILKRV